MAERKPFLLRLDPALFAALQRWADDDLRSLNGQLEFLLRRALIDAGRAPQTSAQEPQPARQKAAFSPPPPGKMADSESPLPPPPIKRPKK